MAKARKRIGLQASRLEYGYGVKIWQEAMAFAEEADVDLIVFPGRNLETPHGFDYQYNRIFSLMSPENLDALVLVTTLVCNYVGKEEISEFLRRFAGMPVVSIGMEVPQAPSVVIDNRVGVREIVRHLALGHGAKRIAFVKGPENNWEAGERFAAYREELDSLGIAFDPRLVAQGDFTPHSVPAAMDAILGSGDPPPQAYVFANDEMAIKGAQILKARGLRVPAEAAIAGFDDIAEAQGQAAPLTTVRQPLEKMARIAMGLAMDMLEGKEAPRLTVLPAEPVIRSSCGCLIRSSEELKGIERRIEGSGEPGSRSSDCAAMAMDALRASMEGRPERLEERRARIGEIAERMMSLSRGTDDGAETEFLKRFVESLQDEIHRGLDPAEWRFILPALAASIERVLPDPAERPWLPSLALRMAALASEASAISSGAARAAASGQANILQDVQFNLSSIMHIEELAASLRGQLPRLGIDTFLLSQYPEEWRHDPRTPWRIPPESRFAGGMEGGLKLRSPDDEAERYSSGTLVPPGTLGDGERRSLVVFPLFFRENHYGTIVYGIGRPDGYVYEILTTQIAGILKAISLFRSKEKAEERLRQAMLELESFNKQLSDLSITDDLTGLYNRRGFMKLAIQQLSLTRQMRKNALLIFGDIDGLKSINDQYGHDEGDAAIRLLASVLKQAFRAMDIICRLGGDEFTVFAANAEESFFQFFETRLATMLKDANAKSGKPYRVSISIGCVACLPEASTSLDEYLKEADLKLYERKKAKKEGRG